MAARTNGRKTARKRKTTTARKRSNGRKPATAEASPNAGRYRCAARIMPEPEFSPAVHGKRREALLQHRDKWVNGTVLHYYFFNDNMRHGEFVRGRGGKQVWVSWVGGEPQRKVVRKAFDQWKKLGIGLEFKEVARPEDAEIRIGFMQGDGSWSYIGTYNLKIGDSERTMNFGWDINVLGHDGLDTALHEIGHALGLPHEHQNPFSGIVWDEEAVYASLGGPPNNWDRDTTFSNIIQKHSKNVVRGSDWDANSIMHYPFEPGLIKKPIVYHEKGLYPKGGISTLDKAWVRTFYPPLKSTDVATLEPAVSQPLALANGEQQNFMIRPAATRNYEIRTFGTSDTVIALFIRDGNTWKYQTADDDSGDERNASLRVKLFVGKEYILRVRLKYSDRTQPPAVMIW